ncbi:MAG: hypothetical protein AAFQ84_02550 [Pseudomonadota bacterium]
MSVSPAHYPFQADWAGRRVLLAEVAPGFYKQAAFLDQRAFTEQPKSQWVDLETIRAVFGASEAQSPRALGLIFHMGHCGSTLISRLFGELNGVLSLREPLPLRDLAAAWSTRDAIWALRNRDQMTADWSLFRAMWARTWMPGDLSIVKATSFCDLLAANWLSAFPSDRALFIHVSPQSYLRSIFVHDGYVADIYGSAEARLSPHIAAFADDVPAFHALSEGERMAVAYVCSALNQAAALDVAGDRAGQLDFDAYLADPSGRLLRAAGSFGLPTEADEVERVLSGPVPRLYSKATDYQFGPADREARLKEADARRGDDIKAGLGWIDRIRAARPDIDAAIARLGY